MRGGRGLFYCVRIFLKAVFSLLYKSVAYATEIVQIFKKIKQIGSLTVFKVSHRLHGLHRFSTDDSFVKRHCYTDCSAKAEEFHGIVMEK